MRNAAMAILFGFCATCSNQAATSPSTVAKPPGTAPERTYTAYALVCIRYDG